MSDPNAVAEKVLLPRLKGLMLLSAVHICSSNNVLDFVSEEGIHQGRVDLLVRELDVAKADT